MQVTYVWLEKGVAMRANTALSTHFTYPLTEVCSLALMFEYSLILSCSKGNQSAPVSLCQSRKRKYFEDEFDTGWFSTIQFNLRHYTMWMLKDFYQNHVIEKNAWMHKRCFLVKYLFTLFDLWLFSRLNLIPHICKPSNFCINSTSRQNLGLQKRAGCFLKKKQNRVWG